MKQAALRQAHAALDDARRAVARMRASQSHEETTDAWISFVHAVHRIWKKCQNGAHGHRASEKWYLGKREEQNDDAALQYVHQSRNADNYGVAEGAYEQVMPVFPIVETGEFMGLKVIPIPRTSYLARISSRGKIYDPPHDPGILHVTRMLPLADNWKRPGPLAQLLMHYFENMLEEAGKLQKHL